MSVVTKSHASDNISSELLERMDSVHISLLTCDPHPEIYSLYGHTALRFQDTSKGIDAVINYGAFSFDTDFFVLKFVFGLTDYEMAIVPFDLFCREYEYYGSRVVQQEFNLTPEEKLRIGYLLDQNARPENRVYRYNFFKDNCTTRARNIVTDNIKGDVTLTRVKAKDITLREMIHEMNTDHPWPRLGNDLLLGVDADRPLNDIESMFLPLSTSDAIRKSYITDSQNNRIPLVKSESEIIRGRAQIVEKDFPLSPIECATALLVLTLCITLAEFRTKRYLWGYDVVLFMGQSLVSLVLIAMTFSQHPTVNLNTQILLFNPLAIAFGYSAIRNWRNGQRHWLWLANIILCCLMFVLFSLNVQWIDWSVRIVALSLLVRCCQKLRK